MGGAIPLCQMPKSDPPERNKGVDSSRVFRDSKMVLAQKNFTEKIPEITFQIKRRNVTWTINCKMMQIQ